MTRLVLGPAISDHRARWEVGPPETNMSLSGEPCRCACEPSKPLVSNCWAMAMTSSDTTLPQRAPRAPLGKMLVKQFLTCLGEDR